MSRRHNASRRRGYGRRQHEVRERRAGFAPERDWNPRFDTEDWRVPDVDDDRPASSSSDSLGGALL